MKKLNKLEEGNKIDKVSRKKRKKWDIGNDIDSSKAVQFGAGGGISSFKVILGERRDNRFKKKKRKVLEQNNVPNGKIDQLVTEVQNCFDTDAGDGAEEQSALKIQGKIRNSKCSREADDKMEMKTCKAKKLKKKKQKRGSDTSTGGERLVEKKEEADQCEVHHISSGDEDCSKGMKKWIAEYHHSRPGLQVVQQRIDEFITAHEVKLEQERKEKEALAAEGGWTVVVHHKGRKKTTDAESGVTMGSVAKAVVEDSLAKKKRKDVGLDFYRFQRREAQMNEILTLQSKFEQDKKRIQQLRAARKFRPY